jgi:hypothetical protein
MVKKIVLHGVDFEGNMASMHMSTAQAAMKSIVVAFEWPGKPDGAKALWQTHRLSGFLALGRLACKKSLVRLLKN